MNILHQIVIMLITLGVLVAIHEFGHFWVARKCGVKVLRFSIGFGPVIWRKTDKKDTEFALSLLPLGGYVKMVDEREAPVEDSQLAFAFNRKPVAQRIAIVAAGPLANFVLALLVYWFIFLRGTVGLLPEISAIDSGSLAAKAGIHVNDVIVSVDGKLTPTVNDVALQLMERLGDTGNIVIVKKPAGADNQTEVQLPIRVWMGDVSGSVDFFKDLGLHFYEPKIEPRIHDVLPDSAAAKAGLQKDDVLISADGQSIADWMDWVDYVRTRANVAIDLRVQRGNETIPVVITPVAVSDNGKMIGQVGIKVEPPVIPEAYLIKKEFSVFSAWLPAFERTWQTAVFSLVSLKKMLFGQISYKQLSGPISIAKVASDSANSGIYSYLTLLALLSVSLGVLNLLPVPVLDGGHIFFYLIEWVKGSPVPEKIQQFAFQFGMTIVMSLMMLALFNDLGRLQLW